MAPSADRRSPLAFVVLATLAEKPLHAYALHSTLVERGKTGVVSIPTRASLYPVLDRLQRSGLVEMLATERESRRPERTVYGVTPAGEALTHEWLLHYLSSGSSELAGFVAGLSFAMLATPKEVTDALEVRRSRLTDERALLVEGLEAGARMGLPDLFQLDDHYRVAALDTDLAFLDATLTRLASGDLAWDREWIAQVAARFESGS
jgi:DNA-binding PadR family transcriptional regulator